MLKITKDQLAAEAKMQGNKPAMLVNEIVDVYLRKNFENLKEYFQTQNQLLDFNFFEVTIDEASNNKKIRHNLKFAPTDVILTGAYGSSGSINVGLFDEVNMDISSDGPVRLRFFAGKYWNSKKVEIKKEDTLPFGSINSSTGEDNENNAGIVVAWPGEVLKKNSLWCDGVEYDAKKYPDTAKALWSPTKNAYIYGGSGSYPGGSFKTPDVRGYFIRGLDRGRGVDIGRILGTLQADAMQNMTGFFDMFPNTGIGQANGTGVFQNGVSAAPGIAGVAAGGTKIGVRFDASLQVRTSAETRPINMAMNYIILTK